MSNKTPPKTLSTFFGTVAQITSQKLGHPLSFVCAVAIVVMWAVSGPVFKYSDTWQLVINTGTTIITFLMVFLIQNTQNRDMAALHLKLAELIRVNVDARDKLLNLEDMTEEELKKLKGNFAEIASTSKTSIDISSAKDDLLKAKEDIDSAEQKLNSVENSNENQSP